MLCLLMIPIMALDCGDKSETNQTFFQTNPCDYQSTDSTDSTDPTHMGHECDAFVHEYRRNKWYLTLNVEMCGKQ